jgi:putative DNA primase/helicase
VDRQQATAKLAELRKHAGKKQLGAKKSNGDAKVDAEIARLAALSPVQYEQQRKDAAEQLGLRASILDKLVKAERPDDGNTQGSAIEFPEPEPWPEPINGARLLNDVADAIRNHVVLADAARDTAALWVIHAYLLDRFLVTPRLAITSPEKRCGKTTLLDVLARLVLKALPAAHVTAAAMFRTIEACRPTLLIDEADTFLKGRNASDELRGIINSGHRKGGFVLRTVGDDHEPRAFATYAGCAIALIGRLPETVHDRSVVVSLKRRLPSEAIASFRPDRAGHLDVLARKAARWAADNADRIGDADPEMPEGIFNREADNWRPLLAIADAAGDDWPERAREALEAAHSTEDDESRLAMLLADIKAAFAEMRADRLASSSLVATLVAIEGRPWAEYRRSKPMTQNQFARALKPLGIAPEVIRQGEGTARGYMVGQFTEAFERYLAPEGAFKPQQRNKADECSTSDMFQTVTRETDVTVQKSEKPNNDGLCYGVTVEKGEEGVCAHHDALFPDDGGDEPGLSWRTIDRLASEVEEWAYTNRDKVRTDQESVIEAEIRRRVIGAGVLPEAVAIETERVLTTLFEGREAASAGR